MFLKSSVLLLTEVKSRVRTIKLRNWEATPSQKKDKQEIQVLRIVGVADRVPFAFALFFSLLLFRFLLSGGAAL